MITKRNGNEGSQMKNNIYIFHSSSNTIWITDVA